MTATPAPRRGRSARRVTGALLCTLLAIGLTAIGPNAVAIPPDDTATGDPPPPDETPLPDALDEPAPVPDDSIVEYPPTDPAIVPNANALRIAWVGTPAEQPAPPALLTLQEAINVASAGDAVSFIPNDYAFTGALLVPRFVTLDSATGSRIFGRFTVNGGGLGLADRVSIGVASTGAAVTVAVSDVALENLTVLNPNAVLRPTGIQLAAGVTGVTIDDFTMDAGGQLFSFGINLTSGSAVITDPDISGVATGITVAAAATTGGIEITGGQITAVTSGVSLGTAAAPEITDLEVTGPAAAITGTGIDLANSSGAAVDGVSVDGFARGIGTSTTSSALGPTITDATITGTTREGIGVGATMTPSIIRPDITGMGPPDQSTGILLLNSVAAEVEDATITGMMYGITIYGTSTAAGPTITAPRVTAFGAILLGSTQGAVVTDAVLDAGSRGGTGTGINLVNAGHVTVTNLKADGFLYAIGSQSSIPPGSDRSDVVIDRVRGTGAPAASSGVYLLGATNARITDLDVELTGSALVIHQSVGVTAQDIVVHGREGPTSVTGAAILRAYGSQDVHVGRASLDAGSYGFFYSATDGATVANATVANVVERAIYGRSVANLEVSASSFTGNAAVGLFVVTTPANGISHDIAIHDNVMNGNLAGIDVLQGTTSVQVERNAVSGQPTFVTAGGAHNLLIADNTVDQGDGSVAITVAPLWQDGALAGSYSSSGIRVLSNAFSGAGTWVSVGSPDPSTPDAGRRTLRDPVLVTGNSFPASSTAVHTFPNALAGDDTAVAATRFVPGGPIAVDARDYDDPNDWGSPCRATGYLDGVLWYDGGGAAVYELSEAPVAYPMNCLDLSLAQSDEIPSDTVLGVGDVISWTLTPHNDGPGAARPGWTITQLLHVSLELVSMTGDGYDVGGTTATASVEILAGSDGPPLIVVARVIAHPPGTSTIRDVAYISVGAPSDFDGDGFVDTMIEQTSPLVVPTITTDTATSPTDNDAQGTWAAASSALPATGADSAPVATLAWVLLGAGCLLLALRRVRARRLRS